MARRRVAAKREILPDAKYKDVTLTRFINKLMLRGKKSIAESVVYGSKAIFTLAETLEDRDLTDSEKESLKRVLDRSTFTREDNSNFIKSNFDDSLLLEAADLLKEASEIYSSIDIEDNERLVSSLKECAQIEEQAGILIDTYCAKE